MEKQPNIPYIAFESELARQERHIKRLWIAFLCSLVAIILIVTGFLLYLEQYDFVSYDQDGEGVNIIGDQNGVEYNGPTLPGAAQEESVIGAGTGDTPQAQVIE